MTPFSATLRSEWTKLTSLRSTKVIIVLSVIVSVALTALLAIVVGVTYEHWDAAGRRDFEPIGSALVGGIVAAILLLVLSVRAATAEYGSGMMRLTLTATPRRGRVLAAKATVVAAVTMGAGLVSSAAMYLTAHTILSAYGVESAGLGDPDALRAVIATGVLSPVFPVIALALGIVLRSTAAAIIAVFGMILGPAFLGGLLPAGWHKLLEYTPASASDAISIGHLPSAEAGLAPAVAALVVIAWLAAFLGGAWVVFERRDA